MTWSVLAARLPETAAKQRYDGGPSSRFALLTGALLTVAVAVATAWVAHSDFNKHVQAEHQQLELLARVLDEQATRLVETSSVAMGGLARLPALKQLPQSREAAQSGLANVLVGLPFLRSLSVTDLEGNVLVSSVPEEAGIVVDLTQLGKLPKEDRDVLGHLVSARSLRGLQKGAVRVSPSGVGFIPLLRLFKSSTDRPLLLVGLINPDAIVTYQQLSLGEASRSAIAASYDGSVLAAADPFNAPSSETVARLKIFRELLPQKEFGSYVGEGLRSGHDMVAYRTSRTRPLVTVVYQPMLAVTERWSRSARGFVIVGICATVVIVALSGLVLRSLRAREAASRLRDEAQRKVAQSQQEMAIVMKSVQELLFRTDPHGAITFVNARWSALGGSDAEAAIGRSLRDLVQPRSSAAVQKLFHSDKGVGTRSAQAHVKTPNGRQLLLDVAVVPLLLEGAIAGFAGSAVDITERWEAQQQLQTQLALSEKLLEVNPLPISMTDADGNLVLANNAWHRYLGLDRNAVVGRQLHEVLRYEEAELHSRGDRELLKNGDTCQFEANIRGADGSLHNTRIFKALVPNAQGGVIGTVSVLMDVTDFREAERVTREAKDALEETSRAKSEFVANMSHELRTPLQSIIGFSELGVLRGGAVPKLAGMFEDIHSAGMRMLELVNDLLDVAKIESTVGTFHLERIDLRGPLRAVLRELEPLFSSRELKLNLVLSEGALVAKADPLRFQQLVRNVIANAIKFSPVGSTVGVIGEVTQTNEIHLCVSDQGPGIPQAELSHIFEAFVQSSKTKDGSGGTGLGLAICRKIVEAHGWSIYAENLAKGTAFHINLPMRMMAETVPGQLL